MDTRELLAVATPIVWRRGYQAGLSVEDREDLLQEVLMKYLQAWPDGQAPANVAAWFEIATANAIIDRARAEARRPAQTHPHDDGGEDDPVALAIAAVRSTKQPSAVAIRHKLLRAIFTLIPAEDARLLLDRYVDGYPAARLAADLGITVANLDQRTTRAKRRLRDALEARPDLVKELRAPHPHVY